MKINLGCGNKLLPEYINIDCNPLQQEKRETNAEFMCANALNIDRYFLANSVEDVLAEHFMEHLTHFEVTDILYRIWTILKPGGFLTIVVPDFEKIINNYKQRQLIGDFSDADIIHLKVFSTEKETLHRTVWYEEIGRWYLQREKLFSVVELFIPSPIEICFVGKALK